MQLCARAGVCYGIDYIRIMNVRFIFGLLAVGWLSSQPLRASADVGDNPYQPIVTRNVFSLVPIPTNPPVDPSSLIPPPKITPNGIMTLFGNLQVLFKVAGVARPGFPPKDESYVMSVGDRQDDIEVEKIDEKAALITFNNHGVIQELGLVPAADSGGGAPAPGYGQPGMPMPGMGGHGPGGFGGHFGRSRNYPNGNFAPVTVAGPPTTAPVTSSDSNQEQLTPEAQVIMIEANRLDTQDAVNKGVMPPLPPTALTPAEATGNGGVPLVAPPVPGENGDSPP